MIYLDNAATSFPKPREVIEEVRRAMTRYGGNPGRGSHEPARQAAEKVFACRSLAAELFGVEDPARVFFTMNTTHGLNTVIKGTLRKGDHVLISDLEHNAVWRPIHRLAVEGKITYDIFPTLTGEARQNPTRICAAIARLCRPETRMLIATAASNLCSATLPIAEIGAFCHRHGIFFVVDGAQAAGHIPIAVDSLALDALCVPGHKGLLGPTGCGMVILGQDFLPEPLTEGGNGVDSLEGDMSETLPERYEAGTLPVAAIAGLCEGLRWISHTGIEAIAEYERSLYRRAREIVGNISGYDIYAPDYEGATLLFNRRGMPSEHLAAALNEKGICTRAGYHCSALGHRTLGTPEGGAVRVSVGPFNTLSQIEALGLALREIVMEANE